MGKNDNSSNSQVVAGEENESKNSNAEGETPEGEEQQSQEDQSGDSGKPDDEGLDALPEKWQKQIADLRREAANHRIQRNAAKEEAKQLDEQLKAIQEAGSSDDSKALIEQLQKSLKDSQVERDRATIAREFELPTGFDVLLTGDTEDVLKAQAKALASLSAGNGGATFSLPNPKPAPGDPTGGRAPGERKPATASENLKAARATSKQYF